MTSLLGGKTGSGRMTGLRKVGSWHQQLELGTGGSWCCGQTRGLTLGGWLQLLRGKDGGGVPRGGGKMRLPSLPQEGWSLASYRSYPKRAKSGVLFTCIWLSLGTGQGGSLKISEPELPPRERKCCASNLISGVGAEGVSLTQDNQRSSVPVTWALPGSQALGGGLG